MCYRGVRSEQCRIMRPLQVHNYKVRPFWRIPFCGLSFTETFTGERTRSCPNSWKLSPKLNTAPISRLATRRVILNIMGMAPPAAQNNWATVNLVYGNASKNKKYGEMYGVTCGEPILTDNNGST
jgi:hypothetical protein